MNEYTTGKNYMGVTEGTFKLRFSQHTLSFGTKHPLKGQKFLNKYVWQCRSKGNISRGARERRRREPLEGSGGMLPQKI